MHHVDVKKRIEKELDENHTRKLRTILNKSLKQHTIKQQLYDHLSPISKQSYKDPQDIRGTAGEARTNS